MCISEEQMNKIVDKIIYGDCEEVSWKILGDDCPELPEGQSLYDLDEEQIQRLSIAATVKKMLMDSRIFNKN